jgi:hypothetical protein
MAIPPIRPDVAAGGEPASLTATPAMPLATAAVAAGSAAMRTAVAMRILAVAAGAADSRRPAGRRLKRKETAARAAVFVFWARRRLAICGVAVQVVRAIHRE